MKRAYAFVLDGVSRRSREWHFDGMTRYKRKRSGAWSDGFPLRSSQGDGAEYSYEADHPLWLLGPLAKLQGEIEEIGHGELIGEATTVRYSVSLAEVEITPLAWKALAHPDSPGPDVPLRRREAPPRSKARCAIPAQVWLDAEGRIRRMGFEVDAWHPMSFDGREEPSFRPSPWSVTELWDFGVEVDRWPTP